MAAAAAGAPVQPVIAGLPPLPGGPLRPGAQPAALTTPPIQAIQDAGQLGNPAPLHPQGTQSPAISNADNLPSTIPVHQVGVQTLLKQ